MYFANTFHRFFRQDFFTLVLTLVLIFLLILPGYSQKKDSCRAGVFLSQEDFVNNRLSYEINTSDKGYKLSFNFPADFTLTLKITTPDSTIKFAPGSVYGYSECDKVYRYYPGEKELNAQEDYYKIEETTAGLVVYSSAFVGGDEIFYSTDLTSPVRRLTLRNLKEDFGRYPDFIDKAEKLKLRLADRNAIGFLIVDVFEETVEPLN